MCTCVLATFTCVLAMVGVGDVRLSSKNKIWEGKNTGPAPNLTYVEVVAE